MNENYIPTALPNGDADYGEHGKHAAMNYIIVFDAYKQANPDDPIQKKAAKLALTDMGYKPKTINNKEHGLMGLGGNGVLLRRRADEEAGN